LLIALSLDVFMDSFFGIGPLELVFILIFALIFLGPERLPTVIRQTGRYLAQLRALSQEISEQLNEELGDLEDLNPQKQLTDLLNPSTDRTKKKTRQKNQDKRQKAAPATSAKPQTPQGSETAKPAGSDNLPSKDGDQPGPTAAQKQQTSPASAQIAEHLARREREQKLKQAALEEQETTNSIAPPELLKAASQPAENSARPAQPDTQESSVHDEAASGDDDSGEEQA
jgi:sec-independent protein translocase protein TatB